ncbi:hypothetical protein [Spirosoma flavum]|uniref:SGNH/GDSL hydrolase family protein n=1 Tax=Spirosoma flavum TaxID=2048557 RepID=A0ABW6AFI1_9BACT
MKKSKYILLLIIFILILTELATRYYGLHQYPLFIESKEFEYIHKPNQVTKIYRNDFMTNEYSMRSKSINKNDTSVVLLIGDSILNGGNTIDQDDLASTLLENNLNKKLGRNIRVLNISSYTWGPDNIYAYLKKYGTFSADLIVYICNSGDAYDPMTFEKIVDVSDTHPGKNYKFGTIKLIKKGLNAFKNIFAKKVETQEVDTQKLSSGFSNLDSLANKLNIPLLIYMHPDIQETTNGQYNKKGKLIIDFYTGRNRKIISELDLAIKKEYYKDDIHFNTKGQLFMSDNLFQPIYNSVKHL